ncbi:hypothetical protein Tco_0327638 [Tanacetum coccineum]
MPPKRTSTSEAPAMTQASAIIELVANSVFTALEAQALSWQILILIPPDQEIACSKKKKCATESSDACQTYQLQRIAEAYKITWVEFKKLLIKKYYPRTEELATLYPTMVPDSEKMMEVFIGGLPQSIKGNDFAVIIRRFIKDFSKIAKSLTELTQKNKKYIWGEDQETAFQMLKQKLYASHQRSLGAVFMQREKVIALYADNLRRNEENYYPYDLVFGSSNISLDQKELNMRQRRWLELLADYDYEIRYHPGKANVVADALSGRNESNHSELDH